jgi:hypothetical protein
LFYRGTTPSAVFIILLWGVLPSGIPSARPAVPLLYYSTALTIWGAIDRTTKAAKRDDNAVPMIHCSLGWNNSVNGEHDTFHDKGLKGKPPDGYKKTRIRLMFNVKTGLTAQEYI